MLTFISFICVLGFLVFVHELGHYLAARKVGVHVLEFSIGFPPKIISKVIGKTTYILSWIPLGGYVRLKGQDIDEEDTQDPENYASKSIGQRFFILVSGPIMNLIVAFLFMPLVFLIGYEIPAFLEKPALIAEVTVGTEAQKMGLQKGDLILTINQKEVNTWREVQRALGDAKNPVVHLEIGREQQILNRSFAMQAVSPEQGIGWKPQVDPIIGTVFPDTPASKAGLLSGDQILRINETKLASWSDVSPLIQESEGKPLEMEILRLGKREILFPQPQWNAGRKVWTLGIGSPVVKVQEGLVDAIRLGSERTVQMGIGTLSFLFKMVTGQTSSDSVGGPIMIAKMVGEAARSGASDLVNLVAFISLQLGLFNLLPIPALDGGHIFFLLIEKIKGSSLSKSFRMATQKVGFSLLMFLILYISFQDSLRLFQ